MPYHIHAKNSRLLGESETHETVMVGAWGGVTEQTGDCDEEGDEERSWALALPWGERVCCVGVHPTHLDLTIATQVESDGGLQCRYKVTRGRVSSWR